MAGLSVILENCRDLSAKKTTQVICKGSMIKAASSPTSNTPLSPGFSWRLTQRNLSSDSGFLDCCFLCKQKLLPDRDIYMYKGDRAFCSVECRSRQMCTDEEESGTLAKKGCASASREYNCSMAAIVGPQPACKTSSSSPSRAGKGPRYRSNAFAC